MHSEIEINAVRDFWENNPLFEGESKWPTGTYEFFQEHRNIIINDFFAGQIPDYLFPSEKQRDSILDLGCGPGFWTTEFLLQKKVDSVISCDLTSHAIKLTGKRMAFYNFPVKIVQGNAESLPFKDNTFSFINCQGVIHHTPHPKNCLEEMFRITKPGGHVSVSVYYLNFYLRHWNVFRHFGSVAHKCGVGAKGRGRESLFNTEDPNELIRKYDGAGNPLGKGFTKNDFDKLIENVGFDVKKKYFISAPSRIFPVHVPVIIQHIYGKIMPYMIGAILERPESIQQDRVKNV
jgi:SAM-dependent methyltransferase